MVSNATVPLLKAYMSNGMNILISGEAGTGKTAMLREACKDLGLTMKYYETPTIDPFTDLVGIPVPNQETETVKYFRPHDIDEADVIFADEINRADPRTLNALFELIQFKTINGEPLPKLKCVVAAMNPDDGNYTVDKLDLALFDRFDIYLGASPKISYEYFSNKYNPEVATVVTQWWNAQYKTYSANKERSNPANGVVYISPRRMDKVVSNFQLVPKLSTIKDSLPPEAVVNTDELYRNLQAAFATKTQAAPAPTTSNSTLAELIQMSADRLRSSKTVAMQKEVLEDASIPLEEKRPLLQNMALAFNTNVGLDRLFDQWGFAVAMMNDTQIKLLVAGWPTAKKNQFSGFYGALKTV